MIKSHHYQSILVHLYYYECSCNYLHLRQLTGLVLYHGDLPHTSSQLGILVPPWWLEIGLAGSIYTTAMSKTYKSGLPTSRMGY